MNCNRVLSLTLLLLACFSPLHAQETVYRVNVRLVRLLVTVKDPHGALVGDLTRDEFTVFDNGVRQEIALFEHHTAQPLSVTLLVDTSASTASKLKEETASLLRFLKALFAEGNPKDAVSLYSFNQDVILETGFTRRIKRVESELKSLKPEAGTSLYDAIFFSARALSRRDGRRVIVVVTDGADTTSVKKFHDALEAAHLADAVLYGIMVIPVTNNPGRQIGGENALFTLSTGTGGQVFASTLGDMLDTAFRDILRALRTQYLIGYYPKNIPFTEERFHKVEVKVKRPDLRVITRTGYYGEQSETRSRNTGRKGPYQMR